MHTSCTEPVRKTVRHVVYVEHNEKGTEGPVEECRKLDIDCQRKNRSQNTFVYEDPSRI